MSDEVEIRELRRQGRSIGCCRSWPHTVVAALLVAGALGLSVPSSASAVEYKHQNVTAEFGQDGTSSTNLGTVNNLAFQQANRRLYVLSTGKIYGFAIPAQGTFNPLGGAFPLTLASGGAGDSDIAVDNTGGLSVNNIYQASATAEVRGFSSLGSPLAGWPATNGGGETCGLGVDNEGSIWGGRFNGALVQRWSPSGGSPLASFSVAGAPGSPCKIAVDPTNNDIYVSAFGSGGVYRWTKASGYTASAKLTNATGSNNRVAVNGAKQRLYVGGPSSANSIRALDTATGALLETIPVGEPIRGITVDESTDTLYVTGSTTNRVKEIPGANLAKAITGPAISVYTANPVISGTADLNDAGPITECYFQFGTTTAYGSKQDCTESMPLNDAQTVHATLPALTGETTYNYRLVVANAERGSASFGANQTFIPRNVSQLSTEPATNQTRTTATLNASFEGTGIETRYYFQWGPTSSYGEQTAIPPGDSAGVTTGPTQVSTAIGGLTHTTTYHYRVVATNSFGASFGQNRTFTTTPSIKDLSTKPPTNVTPSTATLNGELDPDGFETTYYFQYGKTTNYELTIPVPPGDAVPTSDPGLTTVSTEVDNLEFGTTYHYRVVGVNELGTTVASNNQTFATPEQPTILSMTAGNITADSADLQAVINPRGVDTTYHFEYGPTPDFGKSTPETEIGDSTSPVSVQAHIEGLQPSIHYFRLIASNQYGTVQSSNQTFNFYPQSCPNATTRQQTGAGHLPDCRAYELVSPGAMGTILLSPRGPTSAVSSDPSRFAYTGTFGVIPGPWNPPNGGSDVYVSTRSATGWDSHFVGLQAQESHPFVPLSGMITKGSRDLNMFWQLGQSADQSGRSNAPYVFDAEGKSQGRLPTNLNEIPDGDRSINDGGFVGDQRLSPDSKHFFLSSSNVALAAGGLTSGAGSAYDNDLETGEVTVVSKTPLGDDIPSAPGALNEGRYLLLPGASTDGSHVLIAAPANCNAGSPVDPCPTAPARLYMRVKNALTYEVSQGNAVTYEGMTADGSKVFFTSAAQITDDDNDTSVDLYMWSEPTGEAPESLTRLSSGPGTVGDTDGCAATWTSKCSVQLIPPGKGAALNPQHEFYTDPTDNAIAVGNVTVYFYSPEQMVGSRGLPGARNLYVFRKGQIRYVATLGTANPATRFQVTPDGRFASFLTASQLTAYDNKGFQAMYRFDADQVGGVSLICLSCNTANVAPSASVQASLNGIFMADDGRTFFATKDALVARDTNKGTDIYEYVDGRAQLITTGIGVSGSSQVGLVGVSANGVDVYFSTFETLVAQDHNGEALLKFYDARTNGGFPVAKAASPCAAADECHGAGSSNLPGPVMSTSADLGSGGNAITEPKRDKKAKRKRAQQRKRAQRARQIKKAKQRQARRRAAKRKGGGR